jgi:hypothetical protein
MYRTKYDRSGHHEFDSEEGLTEFVTSFCHGNRDCCFLAVLANWRGDSALEWFSGELPQNVEVVDGFDVPPVVDLAQPSVSGSSFASKRKRNDEASKRNRDDDETDSQISEIINSLKRSSTSNESPEKKEYYKQKTRVLEVVAECKKIEMENKKREAAVSLAREFSLAEKNMENTSDDEEQNRMKKRLKKVSMGMLSRIMDEVKESNSNH